MSLLLSHWYPGSGVVPDLSISDLCTFTYFYKNDSEFYIPVKLSFHPFWCKLTLAILLKQFEVSILVIMFKHFYMLLMVFFGSVKTNRIYSFKAIKRVTLNSMTVQLLSNV